MTEPNPYAAPREQEPVPEAIALEPASPGARLVARLWFAALLGCLIVGGVAALGLRWAAWNATGINLQTHNAVLMLHGNLMTVGLAPGATMAAASLAAAEMRARPLGALTRLGVGTLIVWVIAVGWAVARAMSGLPALKLTLWLTVAALAGSAVHVGISIARRSRGTGKLYVVLAGVLAAGACALAITMASQPGMEFYFFEAGGLPIFDNVALQSRAEVPLLGVAVATGLLALRGEGKSHLGIVYVVMGVAPSLLVCWGLRRLLALPGVDLHIHDTLVETARVHAGGSALLCALLAIGHARFHTLAGRGFREGAAIAAAVVVCAGLLATSITLFALGRRGMPVRYGSYLDQFVPYQRHITIAALVAGVGLLLALLVLALPARRSRLG